MQIYIHFFSVNVSQSTLARLESRLVMLAGNYIAWNMAFNLMVRCHQTKLLEEVTTVSTLSLVRQVPENTYPELFSLT